jgi:hypothetical protein
MKIGIQAAVSASLEERLPPLNPRLNRGQTPVSSAVGQNIGSRSKADLRIA